MELRLLTDETERQRYARGFVEARIMRGAGYRETEHSVVGEIHLKYKRLYGLFDQTGPCPDEMIAGIAVHSLATFGQTCPRPDMSHLPPESVYEFGLLWAAVAGAAQAVRYGGAIISGLLEAQGLVIYPMRKPWNLTMLYKDFQPVGEPMLWPWARTLDGGSIYVQPMVLEGPALVEFVARAWERGFETYDHDTRIRFDNPFPLASVPRRIGRRPTIERPEVQVAAQA